MLLFFYALATNLTDAIGLILAVAAIEIAREVRAWQHGRRLRDVERNIEECLRNHKKPAPRKPRNTGIDPSPSVHGSH